MTDAWSARPKLNVSAQGFRPAHALIAFRFCVASSSDIPPERNTMPVTAAVIVVVRVMTMNKTYNPFETGKLLKLAIDNYNLFISNRVSTNYLNPFKFI